MAVMYTLATSHRAEEEAAKIKEKGDKKDGKSKKDKETVAEPKKESTKIKEGPPEKYYL